MNLRRKRSLILLLWLLVALVSIAVLLTWRQVRQAQLGDRLIAACKANDAALVAYLLHQGANPKTHAKLSYYPSWTDRLRARLKGREISVLERDPALHIAIDQLVATNSRQESQQAADIIHHLMEAGANVNERNLEQDTPLIRLLDWKPATADSLTTIRRPLLNALIARGADVNQDGHEYTTPLMVATSHHDLPAMTLLLAHGAKVNVKQPSGQTALAFAMQSGSKDAVRLLLAHHAEGYRRLLEQQREPVSDRASTIANIVRHDPPTSVPQIARLLGVRVGYNGQHALMNQFGEGEHSTGGHPGGRQSWYTRHPSGYISTDGFDYNEEGLALESLYWVLDAHKDPTTPVVRRLPRHAGWLGVIVPGMKMAQVSQLTAGRLPAPQKQGNTWTWTATGFVRPSPVNLEVYDTWRAILTFQKGVLKSVEVRIW